MPKTALILERLDRVEATLAKIGHNGGPPLEDPPVEQKFLTEAQTADRYGVTTRTLMRWDETPDLDFPPPILVRKRRFRDRRLLEQWERKQAAESKPATTVAPALAAWKAQQPKPRGPRKP